MKARLTSESSHPRFFKLQLLRYASNVLSRRRPNPVSIHSILPWIQRRRLGSTARNKQLDYEDFFRCTDCRWLFNEKKNLELRYVKFDVPALQKIVAEVVGATECISMEKIAEGSFNKVFCLKFDNGSEIIARIPFPIAGPSRMVVASEAATLSFARECLHLPVPRVIAWSSKQQDRDAVGTDFILMEKVTGVPLASRLDSLDEDSLRPLIEEYLKIEARFSTLNFSQIGSLYFKDDVAADLQARPLYANGIHTDDKSEKYRIGPIVQREFWRGERMSMNIDRGPWPDLASYLRGIISCERKWLKTYARPRQRKDPFRLSDEENNVDVHLGLLDRLETMIPHIDLPPLISPLTLWHPDLHGHNTLVSETGYPKIVGVIDWQHTLILPYILQATFPDAFHYQGHLLDIDIDDEEEVLSKIADQPQEVQAEYRHHLKLLARHRLFNRMVKETDRKRSHIMSSPMQESFLGIVRYGLRSWTDGAYGLRHALLGLCDEWDLISDGADCPITFSDEEIELHCEVLEKGESRAQRRILLCEEAGCNPDGGVKHEAYDEVKAKAEALRKKWSPEELGPWPLQDGASTSLL